MGISIGGIGPTNHRSSAFSGFAHLHGPLMDQKTEAEEPGPERLVVKKKLTRPGNLLQKAMENGDLVRGFSH